MKRIQKLSYLTSVFVALVLVVGPTFAASLPRPEVRCDVNNDGFITGGEIRAIANLLVSPELQAYDADCDGQVSVTELAYINQLAQAAIEKDGGIQEADLVVESGFAPIEVPVNQQRPDQPSQRLFISKDRVTPSLSPVSKSGAILAFSNDRQTDTHSLTVDAVFTYHLLDPERQAPTAGPFGESTLATYLDLKGTVNSNVDDVTSAIIGVDAIFDLEATGLFDLQTVKIGPYYQTDFEGNAEVYGLNASWVPIRNDWQLGSARIQTGDRREHFFWHASADIDYRSVNETGETNLEVGDQFWVGVSLGAKIYPFGAIGSATPHLDLGLASRRDLKNGDDATLSSVALNFPLSEDGKSAAVISHENGENYQTGEQLNKTTIGLSFRF